MMQPFHNPLVIYHAGCPDGFCSAWAANRFFSQPHVKATAPLEFFLGYFGEPPPPVEGRDVFILDYSYKRPVMERLLAEARSLVVLDHHQTARDDLQGLAPSIHFDMERSGAGMAWDHFFNRSTRPWAVNYVEDRDLWRKALPFTEEVNAYLGTLPYNFSDWDDIVGSDILHAVEGGRAVVRKIEQYCREVAKNARAVTFEGYTVPLVNAAQTNISELLAGMARADFAPAGVGTKPAFAMGWFQRHDGRFQYSLRSVGDFDVGAIARKHGGGGHKNASGFEADGPVHLWW